MSFRREVPRTRVGNLLLSRASPKTANISGDLGTPYESRAVAIKQPLTGDILRDHSGIEVGASSIQGRRPYQEDEYTVTTFLNKYSESTINSPETHFFGVFDGHAGGRCSKAIATSIPEQLIKDPNFSSKLSVALKSSISRANEQFLKVAEKLRLHDGSTGICCLLRENKLIVGNVGDSRAILLSGGKAIQLSTDHKPSNPEEQRRIAALGGTVIQCMGIARVNGILAVARAFGNYGLRHVIKADPDIFQRELGTDDDYIVLGSDGLWDVLRNKDVADMVYSMRRQSLSASRMAEELVKQASAQGSMDNITCLVVHFRDYVARVTALRQSHGGMNGPSDDSGPCLSPNTSGAQIEVSAAPSGGSAVGSSGGKGPGSRTIGGEIGWVDPVVVSVGGLVNGAANSGGVDVLGMYPSSLPSSLKSNPIQLINGNAGALLKAVGSAAAAGPGEGGGYNRMVFLPTSTPTTPTHLHNYSGHGNRKGKSVTISANPIAGHGGYSSLVPTEGGHSVEGQTANNNMRINNSGGIRRESSGTSSQRQQQKQALHLSFDSHDRVGSGDRDSSQRGGGDMKIANKRSYSQKDILSGDARREGAPYDDEDDMNTVGGDALVPIAGDSGFTMGGGTKASTAASLSHRRVSSGGHRVSEPGAALTNSSNSFNHDVSGALRDLSSTLVENDEDVTVMMAPPSLAKTSHSGNGNGRSISDGGSGSQNQANPQNRNSIHIHGPTANNRRQSGSSNHQDNATLPATAISGRASQNNGQLDNAANGSPAALADMGPIVAKVNRVLPMRRGASAQTQRLSLSQRNSANNGINGVNSGSDVGKSQGKQMLATNATDTHPNHQIMPRQQLSGNYSHYSGGLEKDAGPGGGGSNPYTSVSLPIAAPSPGAGSGASSSATASKHPLITLSINNATSNTNHVPGDKVMSAISTSNVSDSMMFSRRKENPLYF